MAKKDSKQKLFETMAFVNPEFITKKTKRKMINEWGESGYYPPGAEHDPTAPWNQVDAPEFNGDWGFTDWSPDPQHPEIGLTFSDVEGNEAYKEFLGDVMQGYVSGHDAQANADYDQISQFINANPEIKIDRNGQFSNPPVEQQIRPMIEKYVNRYINDYGDEIDFNYPEEGDEEAGYGDYLRDQAMDR